MKNSITSLRPLGRPLIALCMAAFPAAPTAHATVLAAPTVTGGSAAFSGSFAQNFATDGAISEYASAGQGANTFLTMQFGGTVTFDRVIAVNRLGDVFANYSLSYDGGGVQSITGLASGSRGRIDALNSPITTQSLRWDVDTLVGGTSPNIGVMEMLFLQTPAGTSIVNSVSAYNASTPFSSTYAIANASDGIVGHAVANAEYAALGGTGAALFVDFNLGSAVSIAGFDFIDRFATGDRTTAFNLIFSDTADFSNVLATRSFNDKGTALAYSGDLSLSGGPITAQYVRFDATTTGAGNVGMNEMIFYSVPEPSAALLGGLGLFGLLRRRRNNGN